MAIGAEALERMLGNEMSIREFHMHQALAKYTPADINGWLHKEGGVVGQDAAVQAVASVIYSHLHFPLRPKQNLLLIGSTGCGKSEIMRAVQRFFTVNLGADLGASFVRTADGAQLNASGWRGGVKLGDILQGVKMPFGCILFIDEFDKCVSERYAGGGSGSWSVSEMLQSQLLTTLDHQTVQLSAEDGKIFTVDCQKVTVITMGAFASIQEKKRLQNERRSIGFSSSAASFAADSALEISPEELAEFGMMSEVAGRLTPVMMDPVSSDMMLAIAQRQVKTLCDTMELHITVPEAKLRLWAEDAFSSGQGGRAIMKHLQAELDKRIFADPYADMYII
jgi:ATP-dependent protease Clp ATPase subunit